MGRNAEKGSAGNAKLTTKCKKRPRTRKNGEYIVEKILGKLNFNGVHKYLVKWKNYPSNKNSWEPLSNLGGCKHLVDEYEAQNGHKKVLAVTNPLILGNDQESKPSKPPATEEGVMELEVLEKIPDGKVPKRVVGPVEVGNSKAYVVEWVSGGRASGRLQKKNLGLVMGNVLKTSYPQILIQFFEERIRWKRQGHLAGPAESKPSN